MNLNLMLRLNNLTSLNENLIDCKKFNSKLCKEVFPEIKDPKTRKYGRPYYHFYIEKMVNRFDKNSLDLNLPEWGLQIGLIHQFLRYIKQETIENFNLKTDTTPDDTTPEPTDEPVYTTSEPIFEPVPTPEPVYNVEMQNNKIIKLIEELIEIKKSLCKLYEILNNPESKVNCNKIPFFKKEDNILEHFHAPELEKSEIYSLLETDIIKNNYRFFDNSKEFNIWSNRISLTERLELWKILLALKTKIMLFANQFVNNKIMESFNELIKINEDLCDSYCAKREKNRFFHTKKRCIANNCLGIRSFLQAVKESIDTTSKSDIKFLVVKKINKILAELIPDKNGNKLYLNSLDIDKKIELLKDLIDLIDDFNLYYILDGPKYVSIVRAYKSKKGGKRSPFFIIACRKMPQFNSSIIIYCLHHGQRIIL